MQVGLNEAARLTGKDQSTITRACQSGRLSFTKDESHTRHNPRKCWVEHPMSTAGREGRKP